MTFDLIPWKKPAKVREAKAEREIAEAALQQKSNEVTLDVIRVIRISRSPSKSVKLLLAPLNKLRKRCVSYVTATKLG